MAYCQRPSWWTVEEAQKAMEAGYVGRMMLEISPERDFSVLSPAFKGNEGNYALQIFSKNWCTFFKNNLCEIFCTGFQPLECRYCHHERKGSGQACHLDIEKDWKTRRARDLIKKWGEITGFRTKQEMIFSHFGIRG
jgi:hypothetical protein